MQLKPKISPKTTFVVFHLAHFLESVWQNVKYTKENCQDKKFLEIGARQKVKLSDS